MTRSPRPGQACPHLLAAAKRALTIIEADYAALLESSCLLDHGLNPIRETLEPSDETWARDYEETIEALKSAIAAAEAGIDA